MSVAAPVPASRPKKKRTGLVVFLLLALGAVCVGVPLLFCGLVSSGSAGISKGTVISLRFDGPVADGPATDPFAELSVAFAGGGPLSLHDLRTLVEAAKDDDKVAGIMMEVGHIGEGMGKLEEIRGILGQLKGKKKLYAYINSDFVGEDTYYVASVADKIVVNAETGFALNGFNAQVTFWRGTLEKLKVQPDVIMFKEYKSAGEPFANKEMSKPFEEWITSVLNQYYDDFCANVAKDRGLDAAHLKELFNKGGLTTPEALKEKLIDATGYPDELEKELRLAYDANATKPNVVGGRRYLASKRGFGGRGEKIAVIYAIGPISSQHGTQGIFGGEGIAGPDLAKTIHEAAEDDSIKAIVMRVDSPGGSAIGSDYVRREIELAKAKGKPFMVSMGTVAGSGGYWISMDADKIVAQPSTLTGSIGVVFTKFNLKGFYEYIGANIDNHVKVGDNADILSESTSLTESQKDTMKAWMTVVYDDFVNAVAKGRKKTYAEIEPIAHGRVWTGKQALDPKRGLVDELGGLDKAIELAKAQANITGDHQLVVFPRQKNFFEALAEGMENASIATRINANPSAMEIFERFRKDAETPKVQVLMPEVEVH